VFSTDLHALVLTVVLALAVAAQTGGGAPPGTGARPAPPGLDATQLAGQRVVVGYDGTNVPAAVRRAIGRGEAGGVILFGPNVPSAAALRRQVRELRAIPRPRALRDAPPLVMLDQEGGLVKRLPGPPSLSPAALGRARDAGLAFREGRATGALLRSAGVNVDLAPVMDLARPGSATRRLGRSYSGDPRLAGRLGAAFARGLRLGGVASVLKHFPGLGYVPGDADLAIQSVPLAARVLRARDEAAFALPIAAGAQLVMSSDARYPALDPAPAMLSRRIVTGELRGRLGFRGVTITDDLGLPILRPWGDTKGLALRAAGAGNDLLLFAHSPAQGAEAVSALVRRADPTAQRAAVERILALRRSLR